MALRAFYLIIALTKALMYRYVHKPFWRLNERCHDCWMVPQRYLSEIEHLDFFIYSLYLGTMRVKTKRVTDDTFLMMSIVYRFKPMYYVNYDVNENRCSLAS